jgi:hypothetical protein
MLRRVLAIAALVLAVPVLGLPCWIALNRGDLASLGDADLALDHPTIPPGKNGFTFLRTAAARSTARNVDSEFNDRLIGVLRREASDTDWIDKLARKNASAFDALEQALAAPRFHIPVFQVEDDDTIDVFMGVQHLARIAAAQAQSLAAQGKTQPALEHALLGMRVSRKLSEASGTHILAMVFGASNQSISLVAIERLLRNDLKLSPSESRWLGLQLDSYRASDSDWQRAWATEYQWTKASFAREMPEVDEEVKEIWREIEENEPPSGWVIRHLPDDYLLHPNRTLDRLAEIYRDLSERSALTCLEWSDLEGQSDNHFDEPSELETFRDLLLPNYWGRTTVEILRRSNPRFLKKRCHLATRTSLVHALAGLNAHHHATGRPPNSLDELVPTYLGAVPQDHYDGSPLRYSAESRTAYSIGDDFIDEGPPDEASQVSTDTPAIRL